MFLSGCGSLSVWEPVSLHVPVSRFDLSAVRACILIRVWLACRIQLAFCEDQLAPYAELKIENEVMVNKLNACMIAVK